MTEWILAAPHPYPWTEMGDIAFRGYVWRGDGKPLTENAAASLFSGLQGQQDLQELIEELEGVFSVIIRTGTGTLIGCDPTGFFPVFYAKGGRSWVVSDDPYRLSGLTRNEAPNTSARAEYLSGGHVLGNETLLKEVFRIRPGEALYLKNSLESEGGRPFAFFPSRFSSSDTQALKRELSSLLDTQTRNLLNYLGGSTAVIPLSGGYDSRLIACLLKEAGYEKVVCFTYGKYSQETMLSKNVAGKLGFPWHFVDYEKLETGQFPGDPLFQAYCRQAGTLGSMPFLQEYFAVKHLTNRELLPADSIILPGHPGDNLAGSFIPRGVKGAFRNLPGHIVRTFFPFLPLDRSTERHLEGRVRHWLAHPPAGGREHISGYTPAVETWNFSERLPKFIFNSARVFPFFGYRVFFPLWSRRMADFFSRVPYPMREGKKLYDELLESRYFKPLGVGFGSGEIQPGRPAKVPHAWKQLAWRLLPAKLLRNKAGKADWICYGKFTAELGRDLKTAGIRPFSRYRSLNALICQWYLENAWKRKV